MSRGAALAVFMLTGALPMASLFWSPFHGASAGSIRARPHQIQIVSDNGQVRTVRHAAGATVIPAHPHRIAALAFADELLTLGVQPAAVTCDWSGSVQDYLAARLSNPQLVPQGFGSGFPALEAIAAARPDLILAAPVDQNEYLQLSAIAPTVVLRDALTANHENGDINALKQRVRDLGAVIGRGAEADNAILAFDRHAAAARALVGKSMRGKTIAFFRTREREWRLYGERGDNGAEAIYPVLGLRAPAMVSGLGLAALDPESMAGFDVDYLIVVGDETLGAHQTLNRLRGNPLWKRISAIRQGHVLEISTYRHWVASGLLGKTRIIDEFVECIRGARR